ncbi:hypothetical protein ACIA8O_34355 [Kitasatospora sp. NPDC051853]|uniref:hypothetical protein n=1 Tax=Kitasatospora sp. NPDC051853 TaxID=3364058 RepID=UPI00378C1A96
MTDAQPVPDHFWDGSFTLGAAPDPAPAPDAEEDGTEPGTALDALGPSGIRLGGRDLAAVLTTAYRRMTGAEPGVR